MSFIRTLIVGVLLTVLPVLHASAEQPWLKPYMMSSQAKGNLNAVAEKTTASLKAAGFQVVGSYSPYKEATIIAVTNDALKSAAAKTEFIKLKKTNQQKI